MKVAAIGPDFYSDKSKLHSKRLERLSMAEGISEIFHFFRGDVSFSSMRSEKNKKIKHVRLMKNKNRLLDIGYLPARFFQLIKSTDADLLYSFSPYILIRFVSKLGSIPQVTQVGSDTRDYKRTSLTVLKNSEKVVFLANHLYEPVKERGVNGTVIYPVFPLNEFYPKKRGLMDEKRLLYVGRIAPQKGLHHLLEAYKMVVKKFPKTHLQIIGDTLFPKYEKYKEKILKMIKELKKRHNVEYLGWVSNDELPKYYKNATLTILPSHTEGFNQVFAESLASGTPIVASDIPFHREVLAGEKVGKITSLNPVDLAESINELLNNSSRIHRMSRRGIKYIQNLARIHKKKWIKLFSDFGN